MKKSLNLKLYRHIAHRGLHDDQSPENSISAFKKAVDAGFPIELDIHLTKDGKLVVFHDSDLHRMTGQEGFIEDKTVEQLRLSCHLPDGSDIPLFEEVLDLVEERVPIVVELKPFNKNWKSLAKAALIALEHIQNKEMITIISFDPRCLFPARKGPFTCGLLIAEERKDVLFFRHFFDYLDVQDVLLENKKVLSFHKKKPLNVWTIRSLDALKAVEDKVDMMTFENIDPALVKERA